MGKSLAPEPQASRSRPIAGEIADVLQKEIIGGRFKPGQRLIERDLILRFGVSSIPVREALQELEGRGLLVRRHNVGCSVIQLTPLEAVRICELRRTLEPRVVEWACQRISDTAISSLEAQFQKLKRAAERKLFPVFFQEDITFHRMIWAAAENPYAARSLDVIMGALFAAGLIGAEEKSTLDLPTEVQKHRRLMDSLARRDAQSGAAALLEIAMGFERHVPGSAA